MLIKLCFGENYVLKIEAFMHYESKVQIIWWMKIILKRTRYFG